jgi:uncharacterized protein (TIGR00725 family)
VAPQIGVAVYSGDLDSKLRLEVSLFTETLSKTCPDAVLVVGGYRGGMRVVVDEALKKGLKVVMVLPRDYEGDPAPSQAIAVRTGMDVRGRSVVLVRSSDVLVVMGGGSGTLMEAITAYSIGVPVVYLVDTGYPTDALAAAYPRGEIDPRIGRLVYYVTSGREAAEKACRLARGV